MISTNQILTGSSALNYHFPNVKREVKDIDWFVKEKPELRSDIILDVRHEFLYMPVLTYDHEIITPEELLSVKISHTTRPNKYIKHLNDIRFLLAQNVKPDFDLIEKLCVFWEELKGVRTTPDFSKTNEEFFTDKVEREIDHDTLHKSFCFENNPLFLLIKEDIGKAEVSKTLFDKLPYETKLHLLLEEAMVLAYERFKNDESKLALHKAFNILNTRLYPEYMAIHCLSHYNELITSEHIQFYNECKEKLKNY